MLRHMQQRRADVVAAVVKMWAMWRIKNLTPSYDVYLLEEQSIRFHPSCIWNDRALGFFWKGLPQLEEQQQEEEDV